MDKGVYQTFNLVHKLMEKKSIEDLEKFKDPECGLVKKLLDRGFIVLTTKDWEVGIPDSIIIGKTGAMYHIDIFKEFKEITKEMGLFYREGRHYTEISANGYNNNSK